MMVVVEYLYEDMKKLINLPLLKVVNGLSELGAPSEYREETKKIITELTPNRPDWYSMEGLARALRCYYTKKHPEYTTKKSDYEVIVDPSVASVRPYTVCAVIRGLKLDDSRIRDMILLQEKLIGTLGRQVKKFGIGLFPLHAIKFPLKYTTMEPNKIRYIPLGFGEEMSAVEILEKHKKGQQYGHLLKNHERYPVYIDATGSVMVLIPIVNSTKAGKVDEHTNDIFIEVTGNGIEACKAALNILVCTFADMGGTIYEVKMRYGRNVFQSPDLKPKTVDLDIRKLNTLLGVELRESEVSGLLSMMGYEYTKNKIVVPPYRADVMGFIDVVEDIAIAYGYNNFKPTIPNFFSPGQTDQAHDYIDEVMRGMGFLEIKTFVLTNREKLKRVGYVGKLIEITNPSSEDFTTIRPNLVVDMLDSFAINKMKGLPQKLYEVGLVHTMKKRLIFGVMDKNIRFSDVRGHLQTLGLENGFEFSLVKKDVELFEPDISCGVLSKGKEVGIFGNVKVEVLSKFGLDFQVYLCELEI